MHSCTRSHVGIGLFIIPLRLNSPQPVEEKIPPSGLGGASLEKNSFTGSSPPNGQNIALTETNIFLTIFLIATVDPRLLQWKKSHDSFTERSL
jgi:hypothetical protein